MELIELKIKEIFYKYQNENYNLTPNKETFKDLLNKEFNKLEAKKGHSKTFFGFYKNVINLSNSGGRGVQNTG